jgi:hypothetical protein
MKWWLGGGEILLVILAISLVVGIAFRRASSDWAYRVRLVRVLALLSSLNTPGDSPDLCEVLLIEPHVSGASFTLAFADAHRPQDIGLLLLDTPLGELAERCERWQATGAPLLLFGGAAGTAVLTGPDGSLAGHVESWLDHVVDDAERPGAPRV